MATAHMIVGDVFDVLATMEDGSVDLILTSPPFLALRSYLPEGHPDKEKEIGSEPDPASFVDTLLRLTAEWGRVLAPHGSICVELGDTYSGSGGAGGDYNEDGLRDGQNAFEGSARRSSSGWPEQKSACLIPELYRVGLAYGLNPLTGVASPAGRWRVRNTVRWVRPNPPVGALGDKFRPATSDMVVACRARDRWFDLDAVRTMTARHESSIAKAEPEPHGDKWGENHDRNDTGTFYNNGNPAGAPPLDWWNITTSGFAGSHYAVFPPELCVIPVKSMCPERVCTVCGEPSRRIAETTGLVDGNGRDVEPHVWASGIAGGKGAHDDKGQRGTSKRETLGFTDCGHDSWRAGVVLDPFGGSGTSGMVATGHGRDAILIDLDSRNVELARDRIGPLFFTHETVAERAAVTP